MQNYRLSRPPQPQPVEASLLLPQSSLAVSTTYISVLVPPRALFFLFFVFFFFFSLAKLRVTLSLIDPSAHFEYYSRRGKTAADVVRYSERT